MSDAALFAGHGIVVPVLLPLVSGALLLVLEKARSRWLGALSLASTLALLLVSVLLVAQASGGEVQAYLLGNWQAPYGIEFALDRLSAMMLLLTAAVACAALVYALGGDARRAPHYYALFQFQLMGLNGAFLTADLFNLFVFFELLLAASYGLLLHGDDAGRRARLKAAIHYVIFNLSGSALFLVAVSLLYGLTGTLNMADLAQKLPQLAPENARLAQAAALLLLVVFAVKAALLPLYFWLPDTYASATASVAALFAIMTKVGVYAIARMSTLAFGTDGGFVADVALPMLPLLALATLVLAAIGALAATRLRGLVAYLVVGSAGTLLLAIGLGTQAALAAGLFYLVNSTLVAAAWFLLAERISVARGGVDALQQARLAGGWAPLGVGFFIAAVAVAGVPPLGGFFGKALLLQAAGETPLAAWVVALVLGSSLALMVALARAGAVLFWEGGEGHTVPAARSPARTPALKETLGRPKFPCSPSGGRTPRGGGLGSAHTATQGFAVVALLATVLATAAAAGPISAYTGAAAQQLFERQGYIRAVLGARPVPAAYDVRREMRARGDAK
jgi:multicomponent K+:H+ antiporter subunit D